MSAIKRNNIDRSSAPSEDLDVYLESPIDGKKKLIVNNKNPINVIDMEEQLMDTIVPRIDLKKIQINTVTTTTNVQNFQTTNVETEHDNLITEFQFEPASA